MIYLIDGPDGAGKTTFANTLLRQLGKAQYVHRTHVTDDMPTIALINDYIDMIGASTKDLVVDRCWVAEWVYGNIMRSEAKLDLCDIFEIERAAFKRGAVYVYVTAPTAELWRRCQNRGEDFVRDQAVLGEIVQRYDEFFRRVPHHLPILSYQCP